MLQTFWEVLEREVTDYKKVVPLPVCSGAELLSSQKSKSLTPKVHFFHFKKYMLSLKN